MKTRRNGYRLWIMLLLVLASWQLGQGFYIQAKAVLAQKLLENAWAEMRNGGHQVTPWSWADTWPVARLSVPRLKVELLVLAGDSGRTLAFGPGHNFATAMPGEAGSSMISGHRDTHFRFLKALKQNDRIIIETIGGKKVNYVVTGTNIVKAQQAFMATNENRASIHLVTCYPFDSITPGTSMRYIVTAAEVQQQHSSKRYATAKSISPRDSGTEYLAGLAIAPHWSRQVNEYLNKQEEK